MKLVLSLGLFLALWSHATAQQAPEQEFFSEYIRELSANEGNRALGEKELGEEDPKFAAAIRGSTRIILELSTQISRMQDMHLNKQVESVPRAIAQFYQAKIQVHQRLIEIASTFLAGPKEGVDYGALAAEMPKLTAQSEYIDHSLFEATPLIFATLIDDKPDKNGHMSRLIITKQDKEQLLQRIQTAFGEKLKQKERNYIVGSAMVLRDMLQKNGYHCSDEPD